MPLRLSATAARMRFFNAYTTATVATNLAARSGTCNLRFFVLFLVLFLFFKFFLAPGVVAHSVVGDGAGIDDDGLAATGLELHLAEVERGGLKGVEEESGDFRI